MTEATKSFWFALLLEGSSVCYLLRVNPLEAIILR